MPVKVLAIAAISDRLGMVFLIGDQLKDWSTSETGAFSSVAAAACTQELIGRYQPTLIVTEKVSERCQKAPSTLSLMWAIARTAESNEAFDISVERKRTHSNKYEEAEALAQIYPEIAPWVPEPRKYYSHQPRNMVIFEALALAHSVREDTARLGEAMQE